MNVVIRADAAFEIGTGHVMRCLAMANQFSQEGAVVTFICRNLQGNSISFIQSQGFQVHTLTSNNDQDPWRWMEQNWKLDALETIQVIEGLHIDLLIVDHYGLDVKWESELRPFTKKIMVIDDLANRLHDCDLLLDQNYYLNLEVRYDHVVPKNCVKFLGPQYVLLRDEFIIAGKKPRARTNTIKNILVFFGGSDPTNETEKTLQALNLLTDAFEFHTYVVVGQSNPNRVRIEEICKSMPRTHYYCQVTNMAELLVSADLAIGAGGSSMWERCYLSVPTVTIITAQNQMETTHAVASQGAIILLGYYNEVTSEHIKDSMEILLSNQLSFQDIGEKGKVLFNDLKDVTKITMSLLS